MASNGVVNTVEVRLSLSMLVLQYWIETHRVGQQQQQHLPHCNCLIQFCRSTPCATLANKSFNSVQLIYLPKSVSAPQNDERVYRR
jgi:hypothetical protein